MLFDYIKTLEGFLRDRSQRIWNPDDLVRYVNRARREVAMRTQCIRLIPPISGPVERVTITNPGSGYTNPSITISAPDFPAGGPLFPAGAQATGLVTQIGGMLSNVSVLTGGSGYFQPAATINDPTGSGATVIVTTTPTSAFVANQEEYFLADIPVETFPGVKSVFATLSHYVIYSNLRYRLTHYSLTDFKSFIENYPFQYTYVPVACAQKGQGAAGSFLFYPIPSQKFAWEPDCLCLPNDLVTDADFEAVPEPWTDAVPYLAAAFAYQEAQSFNNARYYHDQFKEFVGRYSVYARPRMLVNTYGRA